MARTVTDLARVLDCMVGYDPDDPVTARGVGRYERGLPERLDQGALRGARLGILREPMGYASEPDSDDFRKVDEVFNRAVVELRDAGAEIVDPVVIPDLKSLLAKRVRNPAAEDAMFEAFFSSPNAPFKSRSEAMSSPLFAQVTEQTKRRWAPNPSDAEQYAFAVARETLMTNLLDVMARHRLDAIVHKAVEHQPTLIKDGVNPPFVDQKGAPHINTYLMFVPSIVVPAGYTRDDLPAGITFLGRPYDDARMIQFAHAYEVATSHRRVPNWS
jgi:Asp-tRNA(Asn)/Glu-tRNA(Gln) amidotransferase A subunit family amidase